MPLCMDLGSTGTGSAMSNLSFSRVAIQLKSFLKQCSLKDPMSQSLTLLYGASACTAHLHLSSTEVCCVCHRSVASKHCFY